MFNANPAMRLVHSKAKEGCAQAYEALILGMFESMKHFPGFLGAELLPPTELNDKYQVITKFASEADLERWDISPERKLWHQRLKPLFDGDPEYSLMTGLEAWFSLPEAPTMKKPIRTKMALLTWLGIWPTVSFLLFFIAPYLEGLPFLAKTGLITGAVVLIMTYLVMPQLAKKFNHWLHSH